MKLSQFFIGVAAKRLAAVETNALRSHQHEFNGVTALKTILGEQRAEYPARLLYVGESEDDIVSSQSRFTWYDARERDPDRSEYRLYFSDSEALEQASEGDLLVIARLLDDTLLAVIAVQGSTAERQMQELFALSDDLTGQFSLRYLDGSDDIDVSFARELILSTLDIEPPHEVSDLEIVLEHFPGGFPSSSVFSEFARSHSESVDPMDAPDAAFMAWLKKEEALFRALERHLVQDRIREGFESYGDPVDEFMGFSLSIQNRRKARAGRAFENQLEAILIAKGIQYSRGAKTERNARPDFLFPGIDAYWDDQFPAERLTMLGVKSTCKDRWRQVVSEADKIPVKHLLTLEPGISENQTNEMRELSVQLVLPGELHETYSEAQRSQLLTVSQFLELVTLRTR